MAKTASKVAAPAKKAVAKAAAPAKKAVVSAAAKAVAPAKKAVSAAKKVVSAAKAAVAPKAPAAKAPVAKAPAAKAPVAKSEPKEVIFSVYSPDSKSVEVAGEFNNWSPAKGKLKKDKDGNWTLKLKLAKGSYQYKVVFDGSSWELDQKAASVMAEHGPNSVIHVD